MSTRTAASGQIHQFHPVPNTLTCPKTAFFKPCSWPAAKLLRRHCQPVGARLTSQLRDMSYFHYFPIVWAPGVAVRKLHLPYAAPAGNPTRVSTHSAERQDLGIWPGTVQAPAGPVSPGLRRHPPHVSANHWDHLEVTCSSSAAWCSSAALVLVTRTNRKRKPVTSHDPTSDLAPGVKVVSSSTLQQDWFFKNSPEALNFQLQMRHLIIRNLSEIAADLTLPNSSFSIIQVSNHYNFNRLKL